jgi:membrane associated rhomboid family serine protease/Flp pilus assembly protein TadD
MMPVYRTPVITYVLIAVNVGLWLIAGAIGAGPWPDLLWESDSSALLLLGAKFSSLIQAGEYWRLVTSVFLHAGLLHLAVNMWALLQLGTLCEVLFGRARFLILYVCSGVMGSYASYLLSPGLGVGASGAIFGLLGASYAYSLKYGRHLPSGMGERLRRSLLPVILLNLAITLVVPIIDKFAHIGGLAIGMLLAFLAESPQAPAKRREAEVLPAPLALLTSVTLLLYGMWGLVQVAPVVGAFRAASVRARRGDAAGAARLLRQASGQHPEVLAVRLRLYPLLITRQRWSEATEEFLALSRTQLQPPVLLAYGHRLAAHLTVARQGREAESVYRRLLELYPEQPILLNGLAYLYADVLETNLDEAEQMARRALDGVPREGSAIDALTRLLLQQVSLEGMIVDTLAWICFKQGKLDEAYAAQQRAVRLLNDDPEVRYHMGAIEEARGNLAAARHEYEQAIRLKPKYAPAREALRKLRERQAPPPRPAPSQEEVAAAVSRP